MAKKEIICAFGVDVDAVAGQIGSYAGGNSPSDISRGVFAAEVGTPRMLKMFDKLVFVESAIMVIAHRQKQPRQMSVIVGCQIDRRRAQIHRTYSTPPAPA